MRLFDCIKLFALYKKLGCKQNQTKQKKNQGKGHYYCWEIKRKCLAWTSDRSILALELSREQTN